MLMCEVGILVIVLFESEEIHNNETNILGNMVTKRERGCISECYPGFKYKNIMRKKYYIYQDKTFIAFNATTHVAINK